MNVPSRPSWVALCALGLASGCSWIRSVLSPSSPAEAIAEFSLSVPSLDGAKRLDLWATYFRTHQAEHDSAGIALLSIDGKPLGVRLSTRDFCQAAMDGAVRVVSRSGSRTFGFAGLGDEPQTDCSARFPKQPAIARTRFAVARGEYGDGAGSRTLVPLRSIAVDRRVIPIGSVVFVPAARGIPVTRPDGREVRHDGYFFAATTGGAIDGRKIDVFLGPLERNPFAFVRSSKRGTFEAFIIEASDLAERFEALHGRLSPAIASDDDDRGGRPVWSSRAWAAPW